MNHTPDLLSTTFTAYHRAVNMSAAELRRWAENPLSRRASLDREPLERNIRLLSRRKDEWTARDVLDAQRTISFVARMRGVKPGRPVGYSDLSKRDIALRNWGYDPVKDGGTRTAPRVRLRDRRFGRSRTGRMR